MLGAAHPLADVQPFATALLVVVSGLVPHRPDDKFGLGFIYSHYSDLRGELTGTQGMLSGPPVFPQDFEANVELSYLYQVVPGWTLQPDLQYVWHPSGQPDTHATVVGFRTALHY